MWFIVCNCQPFYNGPKMCEACNVHIIGIIYVYAYRALEWMFHLKKSHMVGARRIIQYLKLNPGMRLYFPAKNDLKLIAYCDSDWASCSMSRKSVVGYCMKFGEASVSWKAK